jgi:hypothetical protein
MGNAKHFMVGCALSLVGCVGQVDSSVDSLAASDAELAESDAALCDSHVASIDARRSLAVTEQPILERFSFERVMNRLVAQSRIPGLTATQLFQQWWDTQNASSNRSDGPHCDDVVDGELGTTINGFPYTCRNTPEEGAQATCNPFKDQACAYMPIGLFNRFDLAPKDGATCGEYRMVFAKKSGQTNGRDRNLVIFEAAMPNPEPRKGLEGCRPIVNFWAELSTVSSIKKRARMLEQFYFEGLSRSVPAAIDIRHYGANEHGAGQVRTNQFVQDIPTTRIWSLREFKLDYQCKRVSRFKQSCSLEFVPVTDKNNPYGPLFAPESEKSSDAQVEFQAEFVSQVKSLAVDDPAAISMSTPDEYDSAQSQANASEESDLLVQFENGGRLAEAIQTELDNLGLGTKLEPMDIIARAQTQTCAGCHHISNGTDLGNGLIWPASQGFTHVSERDPEVVNGVTRFTISDALTGTFLPARKTLMEQFLRGRTSFASHSRTIGGSHSH